MAFTDRPRNREMMHPSRRRIRGSGLAVQSAHCIRQARPYLSVGQALHNLPTPSYAAVDTTTLVLMPRLPMLLVPDGFRLMMQIMRMRLSWKAYCFPRSTFCARSGLARRLAAAVFLSMACQCAEDRPISRQESGKPFPDGEACARPCPERPPDVPPPAAVRPEPSRTCAGATAPGARPAEEAGAGS